MKLRAASYLRQSVVSLWVTPVFTAALIGAIWLLERLFDVPQFIYWIVLGSGAFTWIGDLINVVNLRRKGRGSTDSS